MAGVPIPVIKELLGHSDIATNMIYAHLSPDVHKAAVEKLPFWIIRNKGSRKSCNNLRKPKAWWRWGDLLASGEIESASTEPHFRHTDHRLTAVVPKT
jgi:hypothetical protein